MTFNVVEAAEYCKCHPETIREHIREGRLKASKPGRSYCITQTALDEFLHELENIQVRASLERRSEKKCLQITTESTNGTVYGTSTLYHPAVSELDALLKPKTDVKQKS
ncbi:TPA: excisionase family DNA-binding protein [Neisseria subflava]|nr:helix-turn-helix domain-containing protein [uncultured Neisseria sp.]